MYIAKAVTRIDDAIVLNGEDGVSGARMIRVAAQHIPDTKVAV